MSPCNYNLGIYNSHNSSGMPRTTYTSHLRIVLDGHIRCCWSHLHSHLDQNSKVSFQDLLRDVRARSRTQLTEVPATAAAASTAEVVLHWAKVGCLGVVVAHVVVVIATTSTTVAWDLDKRRN